MVPTLDVPSDRGPDVVAARDIPLDRGADSSPRGTFPSTAGWTRGAWRWTPRRCPTYGSWTRARSTRECPRWMRRHRGPRGSRRPMRCPVRGVARDGAQTLSVAANTDVLLRFDAAPTEHVALRLDFTPTAAGVVLSVDRWDGAAARGAVAHRRRDRGCACSRPSTRGPRTFWARVRAPTARSATARLTVTPHALRATAPAATRDCAGCCSSRCATTPPGRLRPHASDGVPLPVRPARPGDVRAGRRGGHGRPGPRPFVPEDLSQWDGLTPGSDRGATCATRRTSAARTSTSRSTAATAAPRGGATAPPATVAAGASAPRAPCGTTTRRQRGAVRALLRHGARDHVLPRPRAHRADPHEPRPRRLPRPRAPRCTALFANGVGTCSTGPTTTTTSTCA
jgi:hypothetical protein